MHDHVTSAVNENNNNNGAGSILKTGTSLFNVVAIVWSTKLLTVIIIQLPL